MSDTVIPVELKIRDLEVGGAAGPLAARLGDFHAARKSVESHLGRRRRSESNSERGWGGGVGVEPQTIEPPNTQPHTSSS